MEAQRGLYSFFLGSSGGSGDVCKGSDGGDNRRMKVEKVDEK